MSNVYTEPNREWGETLTELARGLSQADVTRPAGGPGWTVGGLLAKVEAEGEPVKLNRGVHRQHHIEQIRKALQ